MPRARRLAACCRARRSAGTFRERRPSAAAALALAIPAAALAWSGSAQNYGRDWMPDDYSFAVPNTGAAPARPGYATLQEPNYGSSSRANMTATIPQGYRTTSAYGRDVSPDDYSFAIPNTGTAPAISGYGSSMPRRRAINGSGY